MKKIFPTLAVFLALSAGGAAVYLFQKQARADAVAASADEILPADTQLLLSVPDLKGTLADWKTTDLYKIWAEPQVQDFLAKPLAKLPPHQEFDDVLGKIIRLAPTHLFVAITSVDEKSNEPHVVAGFDFEGDKAEVEQLLAGAKEQVHKKSPTGKADLIQYQGHTVEVFDGGEGNTLAATYLGHRYLISNDLSLLEATVDRCDHRVPPAGGGGAALAREEVYQAVLAKLPVKRETLIFARPQALFHRLLDLSTAAGQPVADAQRAELEKFKAAGATTAIENGKLRDTFYYLAPGMNRDLAKLKMGSLSLTSPGTLLYAVGMFDVPDHLDLPEGPPPAGTPASGLLTGLQQLAAMLREHGLTLERFRAAFGNEFSLHLDWPASRVQPSLIATVDVREPVAAGKFVDDLTTTLIAEAAWQVSQANGLKYHTLTAPNLSFASPTLALTDGHLVFGLNPPEVRDAAERESVRGANFTGSEAYKNTVAMVAAPNTSFVYLDSPALFERAYGTVRLVAMFGAGLVYPQLAEYVDLAKLPEAGTISKHLSPTVFSQKIDEQGGLLDSVGSVTVGEAAVVLLGGAGAAVVPYAQSQFGAPPKDASAQPSPAPAAAAKPDSSPSQPDGGQ